MRHLLLPLALFALFCSPTRAANRFVEAGVPSPDREWNGPDYVTFSRLLAEKKIPVPRLSDPDGKAILERVWDTDNFNFLRNPTLPLSARMQDASALEQSFQQVLLAYAGELTRGEKCSRETVESMAFLLRATAAMLTLMKEIQMPEDPQRQAQVVNGTKLVYSGVRKIVLGTEYSMGERKIYASGDLSILIRALAETLPSFLPAFGENDRVELRNKLRARRAEFKSEDDLRYFDTMLQLFAAQ